MSQVYMKGKVYLNRSVMFHCGNSSHPMVVPTMSADLSKYGPKMLHIRLDSPRQCRLIKHDITGQHVRLHQKLELPEGFSFVQFHEDGVVYENNGDLAKQFWGLPGYE